MKTTHTTDPATIFAIVIAARKSGDRKLARAAIAELRERHGIRVIFRRPKEGPRV